MNPRLHLMLAVRALNIGGAERQFLELVKKIDQGRFRVTVVTAYPGTLDAEVDQEPGVDRVSLGKRGKADLVGFAWRLARAIHRLQPDVIYSFLIDMNVWCALCARASISPAPLVWGIFGSEPDFATGPAFHRTFFSLQRLLQSVPALVTSDSRAGLDFLERYGFRLRRTAVIHSGTDPARFARRAEWRDEFRARYSLGADDVAVGICSRLVDMKGYPVLALAASRILRNDPRVSFFSIGYGKDSIRAECVAILGRHAPRFHWLGRQSEPERFLSGWDLYCSSSIHGEGFSNSIIEAMACELPCVVTDVGDAMVQVGDTGTVVRPGDPDALHDALRSIIERIDRPALAAAARRRVMDRFTATRMVEETECALEALTAMGTGLLQGGCAR